MIERILIVGHGSIGKRHLRIARDLFPDGDIRVLRHTKFESSPEYSNGCINNISEALAFAPNLAVIANPSTFHVQYAQPLAEAGVHLMVEKPIAASLEGIDKLIATSKERGVVLMTAYNLRFMPSLQMYRETIKSNRIGKVISVRCEIGQDLPSWRPDTDYRDSVSASRELGGGVLLELSHEIDYLRWIFGEICWVQAALFRQSGLEIDVEDTAHLVLGFNDDAEGRVLTANLSMDFVRQDPTRKCVAIGEHGSLRWDGLKGSIEFFKAGATKWELIFAQKTARDQSYIAEWQHFIECIYKGKLPMICGLDGLAVLNIIDAARLSASANGLLAIVKRGT